jgi:hypothetical protein
LRSLASESTYHVIGRTDEPGASVADLHTSVRLRADTCAGGGEASAGVGDVREEEKRLASEAQKGLQSSADPMPPRAEEPLSGTVMLEFLAGQQVFHARNWAYPLDLRMELDLCHGLLAWRVVPRQRARTVRRRCQKGS